MVQRNNNVADQAPPKTFICYRGTSSGSSVGEEIAKYLADEVFSDESSFSPVFFAEKKHYDFIDDLETIFRTVDKVIIVFSTGFFNGFFLESNDPAEILPDPESSTLLELRTALDHGCDLYAVFSGEFSWNSVDIMTMNRLEKYFGKEDLGRIRHISNPYVWKQTGNPNNAVLEFFNKASLYNVREFLRHLSPETERSFENEVTKYARNNNTDGIRAYLKKYLGSNNDSSIESYAAFYLLLVMLRQLKEFEQMKDLFDRYGARFSGYRSYSHIWVLYLIECGDDFDTQEALALSWQDCVDFPGNAGFVHLFADVYATSCERAEPDKRKLIMREWGGRGIEMADLAISLDESYAKYYCTRARIFALHKDYRQAEHYINRAIDKEHSGRQDYLIRLLNYQYYKAMIQIDKKLDRKNREEYGTFRVLQSLSGAGKMFNEDLIWYDKRTLVLLDGSTSLVPMQLDGRWFVQSFVQGIMEHPGGMLYERVNCALSYVSELFKNDQLTSGPSCYPSAAGIVVQLRRNDLEAMAIGDCTGLFFMDDGEIITVSDDSVTRFDQSVLDMCVELHEKLGITVAEALKREDVKGKLIENRMKMNQPDGYRILSINTKPCTAKDMIILPADRVNKIVLYSDGFSEVEDRFKQSELDLQALYEELRKLEADDPDFDKMPRFKLGDDASALIARVVL